jgi:acetyl esterase
MSTWTEKFERFVVRRLLDLPPWLQTKISGQPAICVDGQTLHPEIQLLLAAWKWRGGATLRAESPLLARAAFRAEILRHRSPCEVENVSEFAIDAATGPLRVRHYRPPPGPGVDPLLVFLHGGGFVLGDLDTHDAPCRLLCRHGGMHVLAVDYRLAPEHPFPAAADDALAAFRWASLHAEELGADPTRVCVGGDSAGGNLSAVVAQQARAIGGPAPAAQLLLYPTLDSIEVTRSAELFSKGFVLDKEDRHWFTIQYVAGGVDRTDPRLSPLRVEDASGLCPAYIVTAGFDPLRDEGEAYARKLVEAGVSVTLRRYDGFVHGFLNMVGVSPASRTIVIEIASTFGEIVRGTDTAREAPDLGQANRLGSKGTSSAAPGR